jgi:hypothetical protein
MKRWHSSTSPALNACAARVPEVADGWCRPLEHRHAGDVRVRDPILRVQELGI